LFRRSVGRSEGARNAESVDFVQNRSTREFERRRSLKLLRVEAFTASVEITIIAKLEWSESSRGSQLQRSDIAGMVATVGDDLDYGYIERWLNELDVTDEWVLAKQTQVS